MVWTLRTFNSSKQGLGSVVSGLLEVTILTRIKIVIMKQAVEITCLPNAFYVVTFSHSLQKAGNPLR